MADRALHAVLRDDLQHMEMRLERMEFECRQLRALCSSMRLLADDVQTLEAEDPMASGPDEEARMMPSWEDGSERYLAEARGETIYDPRPAEVPGDRVCPICEDVMTEATPRAEADDPTGLAIIALAAVVDGLICKAQLPMGTQQAPVVECACRTCEMARVLCAALERLGAA